MSDNDIALQQQNVLGDLDTLDRIERFANLMATAKVSVPVELQGNPGDCLAISLQAAAWQMNPFSVAQKSHVIKGKIGYEAQLINAVITRHAPIEGRLQFNYSEGWEKILGKYRAMQGKNGTYNVSDWKPEDEQGLWCEVSAVMHGEDEPRVTRMLLVQAQPRKSTQWATDPKQQLSYATIKRWARLHCPDVILGIYTPDEIEQREPKEKDITPASELKARLDEQRQSVTERTGTDSPSARTATDRPGGEPVTARTARNSPVHRVPTQSTHIEHNTETTQDTSEGETAVDRVRQLMRDNKQVPIAEPSDNDRSTLQMAMDSLVSCQTMEELDQCARDLQDQLHPELKDEAIRVYRDRRQELSEQ